MCGATQAAGCLGCGTAQVSKSAKGTEGTTTAAQLYRQAQQISPIGDAELPDPLTDFATTPFSASIKQAFVKAGYTTPSPIQVRAVQCVCIRIPALGDPHWRQRSQGASVCMARFALWYGTVGELQLQRISHRGESQAQGWPVALSGKDMVAIAKTGTPRCTHPQNDHLPPPRGSRATRCTESRDLSRCCSER